MPIERSDTYTHGHSWNRHRVGDSIGGVGRRDRMQFLGTDHDMQAQHDVGMHQLGRAAHILQARAQLYRGQDPSLR